MRVVKHAVLVIIVAAAAALAISVSPARACSCVPPDPRSMLPGADGAFVGRLVSRLEQSEGRARLTFSVEIAVKGDLRGTVEVVTASSGAACGVETEVGRRIGLLLGRERGQWVSSLCAQVDPDELVAAARPLPTPDGRGPVELLVGAGWETSRVLALDARGRTLAYGRAVGRTSLFSACPGGRRVTEVAHDGDEWVLAVRDRRSLRPVRTQRFATPAYPTELLCEDAGGRALVFASSASAPGGARLLRLDGSRRSTVWRGEAVGAALTAEYAYVLGGRYGTSLLTVDHRTGYSKRVATVPRYVDSLSIAASGARIAGVTNVVAPGSPPTRLVLVTLTGATAQVRTAPLAPQLAAGEVIWLRDGGLAVFPRMETADARLFDAALRPRSRIAAWPGRGAAAVGPIVYGLTLEGTLVRAALPRSPVVAVRRLPFRSVVLTEA